SAVCSMTRERVCSSAAVLSISERKRRSCAARPSWRAGTASVIWSNADARLSSALIQRVQISPAERSNAADIGNTSNAWINAGALAVFTPRPSIVRTDQWLARRRADDKRLDVYSPAERTLQASIVTRDTPHIRRRLSLLSLHQ